MTLSDFTAARYPETSESWTIESNGSFIKLGPEPLRTAFTSGVELGMAFHRWAHSQHYEYAGNEYWYAVSGEGYRESSLFETYLDTLKQQ